jgi:TldD protein
LSLVDEHEGELERALGRLGKVCSFAEMMVETGTGQTVRLDTKSTGVGVPPRLDGVVFRVWTGRRWAEAATSRLEAKEVDATVAQLEREAAKAGGSAPPPGEAATTRGEWTTHPKKALRDLGVDGTLALAKEIRSWATAVPQIIDVQVRFQWDEEERLYANSVGARCHQRTVRTYVAVAPIAMENGRPEFDYWSHGGVGGLECVPPIDEPTIRKAAESSAALLHAKAPPAGEMDVLLDPSVAGLVAHESFGHGTEADQFVRDRSYLKPLVGQMVAPEFVSISDDGAFPGGWGSIYCDDEGHPGQKNRLVDRGRFVGALHDRETAALLGAKATASTRRADFLSRAFVRMTNTYIEPADRTLEELLAEVKHGVLLEHGTSGIEDPLGGQMQLKVNLGHRIENGKLTDLVGSMALSGKVLDFLKATRGVGRATDPEISPGYCGKGHTDYLPVGTGGVYFLSHAIVGPA